MSQLYLIVLSLALMFLTVLTLYTRRTVLAPEVIVAGMFALVFGLGAIDPNVSSRVSVVAISYLVCGVGSFLMFAFVTAWLWPGTAARRVLLVRERCSSEVALVIIAYALLGALLWAALDMADNGPFNSGFRNLRFNVTSEQGSGYGVLRYAFPFLTILALREVVRIGHLSSVRRRDVIRATLMIVPGVTASFGSMGRGAVIGLLLASATVWVARSRGGIVKPFAWCAVVGVVIFGIMGVLLHKVNVEGQGAVLSVIGTLIDRATYPLVAWSHVVSSGSEYASGHYTFRFFLAVFDKVGVLSDVSVSVVRPFFEQGAVSTNLYTFAYPYYMDFGVLGVLVFPGFVGVAMGVVFGKGKAVRAHPAWLIILALSIAPLISTYGGEQFFINISSWIQYGFWSLLLTYRWRFLQEGCEGEAIPSRDL